MEIRELLALIVWFLTLFIAYRLGGKHRERKIELGLTIFDALREIPYPDLESIRLYCCQRLRRYVSFEELKAPMVEMMRQGVIIGFEDVEMGRMFYKLTQIETKKGVDK